MNEFSIMAVDTGALTAQVSIFYRDENANIYIENEYGLRKGCENDDLKHIATISNYFKKNKTCPIFLNS
jgi:hypothetical protein